MFLLDIRYDNGTITKWIRDDTGTRPVREAYHPRIYLSGKPEMKSLVASLPGVREVHVEKKSTGLDSVPEELICATVDPGAVYETASLLEAKGCGIYNIDLAPVRQYLLERNLFPMIKLDGSDSQFAIDYELPPLASMKLSVTPARDRGKSYFSYGRILYKPGRCLLSGRLHLDASSFVFREGGLSGLIDLARITGIPVQELSRISPGSAVTALQVNQALQDGVLVPWKRNLAEYWKTAEELLAADRGALVIEPKVGLHENVFEVDFASLFPNIMVNHNISPETVLCKCCPESRKRVPFTHYNICERRTGYRYAAKRYAPDHQEPPGSHARKVYGGEKRF